MYRKMILKIANTLAHSWHCHVVIVDWSCFTVWLFESAHSCYLFILQVTAWRMSFVWRHCWQASSAYVWEVPAKRLPSLLERHWTARRQLGKRWETNLFAGNWKAQVKRRPCPTDRCTFSPLPVSLQSQVREWGSEARTGSPLSLPASFCISFVLSLWVIMWFYLLIFM